MSFSPQLFLSNINSKNGLAKTSRFEVFLPIPEIVGKNINQSIFDSLLNLPNNTFTDVSEIVRLGFGEPTRIIGGDTGSITRYLALQCESSELPGKTLLTADAKIYGPIFKVPYQSQFTDSSFTFICTNQFYERKLFEKWVECIMPLDTNNLRFPKDEKTRYLTNIKVIQFDEAGKKIYVVELNDAFPTGISSQQLSWGDDGFHRLTVQFSYQKYRVLYREA